MESEYDDNDNAFQQGEESLAQVIEEQFCRPEINPKQINAQSDLYIMGIDVSCEVRKATTDSGQETKEPFIIIYGVNNSENSIKVAVRKFAPYFYAQIPDHLDPAPQGIRNLIDGLNEKVSMMRAKKEVAKDDMIPQIGKKNLPYTEELPDAVVNIQIVHRVNLKGYSTEEQTLNSRFLKITTKTPGIISSVRRCFHMEDVINGISLPRKTYESNIPYVLRYMIDSDLTGMGWFKVKKGMFNVLPQNGRRSYCQIEISCTADAIQTIRPEQQFAKLAPLRVMSFDIECIGSQGFPSAMRKEDQIIQIACSCKTTSRVVEDFKVVFALKGASPISGITIKQAATEQQLLLGFQKLIRSYDPDFLIGYNIINFDLKYILERAQFLKMKYYGQFGRGVGKISRMRDTTFQSKVMGMRDTKEINIDGRIQLDLMIHMHREHKLSSYSLNNVSYYFLKQQKEDVHHTQIQKLFEESRESRKRLGIYCMKDAELPLLLMEKLCCLYNYSEMARVTGVPINYLLSKGQQIKVTSQLLRKAKHYKYIMPHQTVKGNSNEVAYEGACVLEPISGFYTEPIATLDFASLYPSIMMAHNLCYTTLVNFGPQKESTLKQLGLSEQNKDYVVTPMGNVFVKKKEGLLPVILRQLITARKQAKRELAAASDPFMKAVLEGRQLALKISANSVYGYTGATVGHLPCLEISSSVTAFGRQMIEKTKSSVLRQFPGSQVIYGDTDSVMVKFKLDSELMLQDMRKEAMRLGREAATKISEEFDKPIKLQFQKVYCPFLLITKKRYAGVLYTNPDTPDKIDKKGIESVRRDNCLLIRQMLERVIQLILWENNQKAAQLYIKKTVQNLVQNKIDISKLVISKAITKKTADESSEEDNVPQKVSKKDSKNPKNTYKSRSAHVQLANKMRKRDENVNIHIGDRISYVMIMGPKGTKNYENSEDPIKVLNQDIPIDFDYYIQKQLKPPLERLLKKSSICPNFEALFSGDHTKVRYIPKVKQTNFLARFVKVEKTCMFCPNRLADDSALCKSCEPRSIEAYLAKQQELADLYRKNSELWMECHTCQGSVEMEVICSNMDCPIYYQRIKYQNSLEEKELAMERFDQYQYKAQQNYESQAVDF